MLSLVATYHLIKRGKMEKTASIEEVRAKVGSGKIFSGESNVNRAISKWHILSPLFIALPYSQDFKPVMLVDGFKKSAFKFNKKKSQFIIIYSIFTTLVSLLLFTYTKNEKLLNLTLSGLIVTLYLTIDYITISNNLQSLTDRNVFISNLSNRYKKHAAKWFFICLAIGLIQVFINYLAGGFEEAAYRYGGIYKLIMAGEWWRIITASFFHSGLTHWFSNLAFALLSGPLFIALVRRTGLFVFISGCITGAISAYFLYFFGLTSADAYGGISAGIYALLGYTTINSYKNKNIKNGNLHISIVNFLFMSTALSALLSHSISNTAHISGFITGVLLAFLCKHRDKYK